MTMRDEITAIIHAGTKQALSDYDIADDVISNDPEIAEADRATAEAILDALPGMIPELVWSCSSSTDSHHQSKTLFGSYYIERGKDGLFYWWAPFHIGKLHAPTIEAAKTAANAHRRATMCKEMGWAE